MTDGASKPPHPSPGAYCQIEGLPGVGEIFGSVKGLESVQNVRSLNLKIFYCRSFGSGLKFNNGPESALDEILTPQVPKQFSGCFPGAVTGSNLLHAQFFQFFRNPLQFP